MSLFAAKAVALVKEVAACDEDQILPYNVETVGEALREVGDHHRQLVAALLAVQQSGVDWGQAVPESATILLHHQALLRNKRCLLTYLQERMRRIRHLRWQLGALLPGELQDKLSNSEKEYFRGYSESLADYMSAIDTDLTVDFLPPRDPYIEVRVLKDAGTLMMDDKITHLEQNTVHLVRRAEAEPLILKGMLEHREY